MLIEFVRVEEWPKESRVHHYAQTELTNKGQTGGAKMGAFETLLELLSIYPQLPGEGPLTVRSTSLGWKALTRIEAVAASRLIVLIRSGGSDPMQYALHSGRIGGGYPVSCARYLGVANPTRRKMEVLVFCSMSERGRARSKYGIHCSRIMRRIILSQGDRLIDQTVPMGRVLYSPENKKLSGAIIVRIGLMY